ncbi:MAG: HEPN domain-containing protein [Candidatus Aminicenantes bacterium]|nr:HEPN domain-containing protein [Candidatus Aminicenantes bacterium]
MGFPSYLINAELIADLASVWFGKRFDVHGPLQEHGNFCIPTFWGNQPVAHPNAGPFSHKPRQDLKIEPTWSEFGTPFELFSKYSDSDSVTGAFWRATRFYARALRSFDNDPEVAFFNLIVAIEMLAAGMDFAEDQIFDAEILEIFQRIREELCDGERVERIVRSWHYRVRRKVSLCAVELTNDNFFDGSEAEHPAGRLSKEDLFDRIKNAFDLRSKYAHAGADIGEWLNILADLNEEIQLGPPEMKDRKLANLIRKAPTLGGLERLVRFMTLRFAHKEISPVHEALE